MCGGFFSEMGTQHLIFALTCSDEPARCVFYSECICGGRRGLTNTDLWLSCQDFSVMFVFSNALTHSLHFALSHQPSENLQP